MRYNRFCDLKCYLREIRLKWHKSNEKDSGAVVSISRVTLSPLIAAPGSTFQDHIIPRVKVGIMNFHYIVYSSLQIIGAKNSLLFHFSVLAIGISTPLNVYQFERKKITMKLVFTLLCSLRWRSKTPSGNKDWKHV